MTVKTEKQTKLGSVGYPYKFYPLLINVTGPEVEALLKCNEAKFYLKEIEGPAQKLVELIEGLDNV